MIGSYAGIAVAGTLVLGTVAFIGYKYYKNRRHHIQKVEMKKRKFTERAKQLQLDLNTIDADTEINGVLITEVDDEMPALNEGSELDGNNCEITLYSGDDVVHMVTKDNKIMVNKHSINNTYPCCKGVNHKEMREAVNGGVKTDSMQQNSEFPTDPKTSRRRNSM